MWVIQVRESYDTVTEAAQAFVFQRQQIGYLGGRIFVRESKFVVQTVHEDNFSNGQTYVYGPVDRWLPEGMLRCLLLDSQCKTFGIEAD